MTAIDKYIRLEAVGYWREQGQDEAREVIVSFGDSTLQLTSLQDMPLTHWSLLATSRIGTRGERVIYSADPEQRETLEIEDQDMIRAISAVTSALAVPPEKTRWGRWFWRGLGTAALLALLFQSPPFIYALASIITPPARMADVSSRIQSDLQASYGKACLGWQGNRALTEFGNKLFPDAPPDILVLDGAPQAALALPANTIVLSRQAVEQADSAETLAALATLAWAHSQNGGPKDALIQKLGPFGALRYMISGTFPTPLPELPTTRPNGQDYLLARDHLLGIGASANHLQTLAEADSLGLPLPETSLPPFAFAAFATLQTICAD